jgi:hypothetical protein
VHCALCGWLPFRIEVTTTNPLNVSSRFRSELKADIIRCQFQLCAELGPRSEKQHPSLFLGIAAMPHLRLLLKLLRIPKVDRYNLPFGGSHFRCPLRRDVPTLPRHVSNSSILPGIAPTLIAIFPRDDALPLFSFSAIVGLDGLWLASL